jgi:hypothetical protein
VEEAQLRFSAPQRIRESSPLHEFADTATPARALTSRIMQGMLQEMGRGGMFQELHARLLPLLPPNGTSPLQFWTTTEAHERFMRIVTKIGGPGENSGQRLSLALRIRILRLAPWRGDFGLDRATSAVCVPGASPHVAVVRLPHVIEVWSYVAN